MTHNHNSDKRIQTGALVYLSEETCHWTTDANDLARMFYIARPRGSPYIRTSVVHPKLGKGERPSSV